MIEIFIAVAVVAVLALALLAIRFGRRAQELSPSQGDSGVLIVPIPNRADDVLLLGASHQLDAIESSPGVTQSASPGMPLIPQVVRDVIAAGGSAATRKYAKGVEAGRVVSITDESMKQLQRGKQVYDKGGNALGLVRGKRGISHVMRFSKSAPRAAVASNAATLAMTAAVSQQLGQIEEQLEEISRAVERLKIRGDSEAIGAVRAVNEELDSIASEIRRRGFMSESDDERLNAATLEVRKRFRVADRQIEALLGGVGDAKMSRKKRLDTLDELDGELDHWFGLWVEAELAYTRRDVLHLYWEQAKHPDSARQLAEEMGAAAAARRTQMHRFGKLITRLADPESQTLLDPARQISRFKLGRHKEVKKILEEHREAFQGPECDRYALVEETSG